MKKPMFVMVMLAMVLVVAAIPALVAQDGADLNVNLAEEPPVCEWMPTLIGSSLETSDCSVASDPFDHVPGELI